MNEEALEYSYELFSKDGYDGSFEEFKTLINEDKEALDYSFELFSLDGYEGDENSYSELIGVKPIEQVVEQPVVDEEVSEDLSIEEAIETAKTDILAIRESEEYKESIAGLEDEVEELKTKTGTVATGGTAMRTGFGMGMGPQIRQVTTEYYVYDELEGEARKKIAKENNIDPEDVSEDDWRAEAKKLWIRQQEKSKLEELTEERLEEFEDETYDTNIFQDWMNMSSFALKEALDYVPFADAAADKLRKTIDNITDREKYRKATEDLKLSFEDVVAENKKEVETANNIVVSLSQDKTSMELELETLANIPEKDLTQADVDRINFLRKQIDINNDMQSDAEDKYAEAVAKSEDIAMMMDMSGRTYATMDVAQNRVSSAIKNILGGTTKLREELKQSSLINRFTGIDITEEIEGQLEKLPEKFRLAVDLVKLYNDIPEDFYNKMFSESRKLTEKTKKHQSLEGINTIEEAGEFALDLFTEQSVNTALTATTGPAGLIILSAASAGGKMNELDIKMEGVKDAEGNYIIPPEKISPVQYYSSGFLYGAAEYVTEKVGLGNFRLLQKVFKKSPTLKGTKFSNQYATYPEAFIKYGVNVNKEGSAEFAAQLAQNGVDKYILGEDIAMTRGLNQAYVSGAVMAGLGFSAPVLVNDIYKAFSTPTSFKQGRKNSETILKNDKEITRLTKLRAEKLFAENDTRAVEEIDSAIKILRSQSDNLIKANLKLKGDADLLIAELDANPRKKQALIDINNSLHKTRSEIDKVSLNTSLSKQSRQSELKRLMDIATKQTAVKERIISEANRGTLAKESVKAKKIAEEIAKATKNNLILNQFSGETVDDIEVNIDSSIDGFKINKSFLEKESKKRNKSVEETELELKQEFKEDLKKAFDEARKEQNKGGLIHGMVRGAEYGMPTQFIVESAAANARAGNVSVISHELQHNTVDDKLAQQDADIVGLVNELESYVKRRYNKAYKKFKEVSRVYKGAEAELMAQEKLAGLVDFIRKNDIKSDMSIRGKLLQRLQKSKDSDKNFPEIKTGEDVFNMLTSYVSSFETGELQGLYKGLIEDKVDVKKRKPGAKVVEKKTEAKKPEDKKQTAAEKMLAKAEAVKKGDVEVEKTEEEGVEDVKVNRYTIKKGLTDSEGRKLKVSGKTGKYILRRDNEILGEFNTLDTAVAEVQRLYNFINNELVEKEIPGTKKAAKKPAVKKPVAKKPKAKKAAKIEKPEALKPLDKKETNAARGRYLNDFIGQSKDWLIDNIDIKNTDEWKKVDQDKKKATKEFIKGKNQSKFSKSSFNKQELDQISKISKEWINEEKNNSTISRGLIGKLTEDVADLEQQELNDRLKLIDKVAGSVSNIKFSKSKDVGPQINKLYDEMTSMWNDGGSDFTFQEIYKNKLLDELIGRRIDSFVLKGKPPGWTNESRADLINQTYLEFLPHIRNFNKAFHNYEKGAVENDNLFAWINSFMNEKVGNSFKKIGLKPEFDVDVTEAKAVTYEETEAQTEEREERDFSIRKKLGLNDDFKTKVFDKVKGVMRGRIPAVNSPEFKSKLEKEFERELFNTIREDVFGFEWKKRGAREVMPFNETKYDKFIRDNFLAMYEKLPLSTLSKMRSLKSGESLVKEVIDPKTGKQRRMTIQEAAMSGAKDVKAGNPIFEKFTPQELTDGEIFTEYFINPKIGRKSMRMEGLAKVLAKEIAFDAVMEVVSDPTVFERMKDIYEIQDIELFGNELEVIGKQIDRNPNLKFSKSGTKLLSDQVFRNKFLNNLDYIKEKITYKKIKNQIEQGTPVSVVFKDIFKQEYKDKNKVVDLDNFAKDLQDLINKYIEVYNNRKGMAISLPEIISLKIDESLVELSVKNLTGLDISFAELFSDQNRLIDVKQTLVDIFSEMNPQDVVDLIYNIKRGIFKDINNFNLIVNAEDFNDNFLVASHVKFLTKKQLEEKGKSTGHWIENKDGSITEIKPSVVSKDGKNGNWLITTKSDKSIIESFERQKENAKKTQEVLLKFLDKLKKQDIDKKSKAMVSYWLRWAGGMNSIVRMSFEPYSIQNQVLENRKTYKDKVSKNAKDKFLKNNRVVVEHRSPANDLSLLINEYLFTKDKNQNDLKSFLKDKAKVNYIVKSLDNSLNKFYKAKTTITNVKGVDSNLSSYYTIPVLLDYSRNTKNKSLSFTVIVKGKQKELSRIDLVDYKPSSNVAKEYKKVKSDNKFSLSKSKVVKPSASMTNQDVLSLAATIDAALENARNSNLPVKKIRVFDFDDTLAQTKSNVLYTMPDGTTGKLTAEEFAKKGDDMAAEGAVWDFSEFNKVMEGRKGPLFKVAEAIQKARGTEDVFILTARAAEAAPAIKEFLDSLGLNIPLKNITGLGDSSPFAKSQWIVEKAAEGYNDFYFADDAYKNVRAVQDALSVIDVKSKVQQAHVKFSKSVDLSETLNDMIEAKKGIPSEQTFDQLAIGIGKRKGKRKLFLPYSAEDFLGLIYPLISKGKLGDAQLEFFNQALFKPFARAMNNVSKDRVQITKDFKALKKQLKNVPKNLRKEVMPGLTYENAVRIYIWDKQGIEVEGVSDKTIENIWEVMQENPELQAFADQLININKGDGYQYPGGTWLNGTITTDLYAGLNGVKRAKYLEEWTRNKNLMFTKENMLKLEAAYGPRYVESLKDILRRMETGVNRPEKSNRIEDMVMNWVNGSVGVTMFLNTRSAILQTISTINFVNWKDNNPLAAGKAFLNFPQFGKDFVYLIKSDFMKDRRSGLKINVSESEVADAARKGGYKGVINLLLQAGFSFTKAGDAFAIAFGGATFYRNRIKTYEKQGMSTKEAEAAAFEDFREITEESQQSARPDKISAQQSNRYGRVILAFANTPMQYNRIIKRAVQDIANGRGDLKSNISKIAYYGLVQNLIFNTLQTALFALLFDDEEDEDKAAKTKQEKMIKVTNGMADSILRGMGYAGAAISVIKNVALKLKKESEKEGLTNFGDVGVDILGIAPPIQAKIRRFQQAGKTIDYNKKEIEEMGYKFSLDNPSYQAAAAVISGATNIPLDRLMLKIQNIDGALNSEYDLWQRLALGAGWNKWNLGIGQKEKEEKKAAKKADDGIVTYEEVKYEKVKYD